MVYTEGRSARSQLGSTGAEAHIAGLTDAPTIPCQAANMKTYQTTSDNMMASSWPA